MVWAGEVTNDTLEPLRSRSAARPRRQSAAPRAARARPSRSGPPGSEGRWSLRALALGSRPDARPSDGPRSPARCSSATASSRARPRTPRASPGGFAAVYDVLKAMEDAGRVRRGYFVAGRGATQFALPGADERLRDARRPTEGAAKTLVLAATDPANPYGAPCRGPRCPRRSGPPRPQRAAGARVILHDGALVGFLSRSNEALLTFLPADEPMRSEAATGIARALDGLVTQGKRRALLIASIDGAPPNQSVLNDALVRSGFHPAPSGALLRRADPQRPQSGNAHV